MNTQKTKTKRATARDYVRRFVSWRKRRQEQKAMARIRRELALWGLDTSSMTDEEIKEGLSRIGATFAKCGVTAEEGMNSMLTVSRYFNS